MGNGPADDAQRIAETALQVWETEVETSYNCFEHVIVQSGRGAGWHQFGGLSSPVLYWYGAYHRPGQLTTGLHAWVESAEFGAGNRSLVARLSFHDQARHTPLVIATMAPGGAYTARWKGRRVACRERYPGVLEIVLPSGKEAGTLIANDNR